MVFLKIAGYIVLFYAAIKLGGVGIAWTRKFFRDLKPPKDY